MDTPHAHTLDILASCPLTESMQVSPVPFGLQGMKGTPGMLHVPRDDWQVVLCKVLDRSAGAGASCFLRDQGIDTLLKRAWLCLRQGRITEAAKAEGTA